MSSFFKSSHFILLLILFVVVISVFMLEKFFTSSNIDWFDASNIITHTYKLTSQRALNLYLFPPKISSNSPTPVILMFHGGGWMGGSPKELEAYCHYFNDKGYTTILASYRLMAQDNTTPFDAVEDANDAYQYILNHGETWGINTNKIIILGGSAGGHLAFWVARKNIAQVRSPQALILLSAVLDTSPRGYGYDKLGNSYSQLSPLENTHDDLPPTLIIHDKNDSVVPFEGVNLFYQKLLNIHNVPVQLYTKNINGHGFYVLNPENLGNNIDFLSIIDYFLEKHVINITTKEITD